MQMRSQKLAKFNIHRHYSCPSICKTSKKLEFHKLSFQKMFRRECNFNISIKVSRLDICRVNSVFASAENPFTGRHILDWCNQNFNSSSRSLGRDPYQPRDSDHQGFTIAVILYKMLNTNNNKKVTKILP